MTRDDLYLHLVEQQATIVNYLALPPAERARASIVVTAENHLVLIEALICLLEERP